MDPRNTPEEPEKHDDSHDDSTQASFDSSAMQVLLLVSESVTQILNEFTRRAAAETGHRCSLTVQRGGVSNPYTVASSDELTVRLDELQYARDDGPCLTALRSGTPVIVTDMATETRFGSYPAHAVEVGARSSMSYPLIMAEQDTAGALNLYADAPLDSSPELRKRAEALAKHGAGALALAHRLDDQQHLISNLKTALESRSVIDQAIGVLIAQQRCDSGAAFNLLLSASQNRNIKLRDVAAAIVASAHRNIPGAPGKRY